LVGVLLNKSFSKHHKLKGILHQEWSDLRSSALSAANNFHMATSLELEVEGYREP
jgi:hypothetical protein